MTWLRVEDTALTHPKTLHLRSLGDPVATAEAVIGFVMLAASWSGAHDTDFFISEAAGMLASPQHWQPLSAAALKVRVLTKAPAPVRRQHGGQCGWLVSVGKGEIFHLLTAEQVAIKRAHRSFGRKVENRIELLLRDGDQCRYCGQTVDENDRRGGRGRTWDHPDPDVHDVLVVACRTCNSSKKKRTVEQWVADGGLPLMPPPAERGDRLYLDPKTREWLREHGALPDDGDDTSAPPSVARTGSQPDAAATAPAADPARESVSADGPDHAAADPTRSGSDPDPIPARVAELAPPGRDGPGRVGSGSAGTAPTHSRDGPPRRRRRRGSRGRRSSSPPPST